MSSGVNRDRLRSVRFTQPSTIAQAAASRVRPGPLRESDRLLIIAADHPARGAIGIGSSPMAMADRYDLLDRLVTALSVPGVNGLLGTPDIVEDLLLLGVLDGKYVFGSMNRGGFLGAVFELDDRFTAYSVPTIVKSGLEGGKMLLRLNFGDAATAATVESCAAAISDLASAGRIAMIEPFLNRMENGRPRNDLSPDAVIQSMAIASGLGSTSAFTWLKIPVVDDMERVVAAATQPLVLLGGERDGQPEEMFTRWSRALNLPGVRGLAVGRNLLYPADDNVEGAVSAAVAVL